MKIEPKYFDIAFSMKIEPKYFDIACERIENAQRQQRMFA